MAMDTGTTDGFDTPEDQNDQSEEFARLLAEAGGAAGRDPTAGDKLTGKIVQIGEQDTFVDCGTRNELLLPTSELLDDAGELHYAVGDEITGHVVKRQKALQLTLAINLRDAGLRELNAACSSGTPVKGKISGTNRGGFTVELGRRRAFCPFSQLDLRRVDDPEAFLGRELEFKIMEIAEDGRNIVISRRQLLEERRDEQAVSTRAELNLGDVREGTVTRLVPFGAFVDIGGVEGLVHVSQIAHERVDDPASVLKEGQTVQVKVIEIRDLGMGRNERIGLSLKALADDPWPATVQELPVGTDVTGTVKRLAGFGAFVELRPGIEGLVHVSEMADRRVEHPREICREGDAVTVRILDVDPERRRISLSLRRADYLDPDEADDTANDETPDQ